MFDGKVQNDVKRPLPQHVKNNHVFLARFLMRKCADVRFLGDLGGFFSLYDVCFLFFPDECR